MLCFAATLCDHLRHTKPDPAAVGQSCTNSRGWAQGWLAKREEGHTRRNQDRIDREAGEDRRVGHRSWILCLPEMGAAGWVDCSTEVNTRS